MSQVVLDHTYDFHGSTISLGTSPDGWEPNGLKKKNAEGNQRTVKTNSTSGGGLVVVIVEVELVFCSKDLDRSADALFYTIIRYLEGHGHQRLCLMWFKYVNRCLV